MNCFMNFYIFKDNYNELSLFYTLGNLNNSVS